MKYIMNVKEVSEARYVIEADSEEEANNLFYEWAEDHQDWIYDDLADCSNGWEYSSDGLAADQSCDADVVKNEAGEWVGCL